MASTLSDWTNKPVTILTCDGRLITGILLGYDQLQNLILQKSYESVYSSDSPVEKVELGLFVVRGDNVAVVGDGNSTVDVEGEEEGNSGEDDTVRAEPIQPIVQNVT
ncbi:human U6 snRNA-associated protein LSm8-like protein [Thalassiosira pseudonana CCMP1335]|uniref:U6 snRNA-associated Sm-like protein LSm8 n=1 Tax=Thalassiosira pseudonana TaxID=35128 RepID=B5YNY4_THAPS|nr:human U6 snRNA-associated protein LSm8-like protein [Thalassiosira pseudonana CCMP1335]ACI65066.1 human U6 snRNA-associated protein LSm8-like protein [Thalassiosira pseudonana CCMP1335]|eukprot:g6297.t1 g6297   contig23:137217-137537(+)